ncbi:MAG: hypothetical protein AAF329_04675, partial [Cyanobacteria bacterium P01_A01_bin.17]
DDQEIGSDQSRKNFNSAGFDLTQTKQTSKARVLIRVELYDNNGPQADEPVDISFFDDVALGLEYDLETGDIYQNGQRARKGTVRESQFIQAGSLDVEKRVNDTPRIRIQISHLCEGPSISAPAVTKLQNARRICLEEISIPSVFSKL